MTRARAVYRVLALVGTTLTLCGLVVVEQAIHRLRSGRKPLDADGAPPVAPRVRTWARRTARIIGMRVRVEGDLPGDLRNGPVAIVANHLSYIDIVALWCLVPGVFVARADVAGWPLIGAAGKLIRTIFIDRTRKRDLLRVLPEMQNALAAGHNVIFFPEGTSSRGSEVLPFKSPLFEAAAREDVPIVTASLQFETAETFPSADWSVCWWGEMPFSPHAFALLHMDGFEARVRFSRPIGLAPYGNAPFEPIEPAEEASRDGVAGTTAIDAPSHWTSPPLELRSPQRRSKERKALCQLAYEAVEKKFIPTTPVDSRLESPTPPPSGPPSARPGQRARTRGPNDDRRVN